MRQPGVDVSDRAWRGRRRGTVLATVRALQTLWAFTRPHTIIGTTLSVLGLSVLAAAWSEQAAVTATWWTLVAALGVNVYIVGLNQVTDVDIDRVNKPWLPLAAGRMSLPAARRLVGGSLAVAALVALWQGPWLLAAIALGAGAGTAYSLPPLRLRRFPLPAAALIVVVRGLVVNLLLFAHFLDAVGAPVEIPRHVLALTGMVLGLSLVIAWFKDIPDTDGDRRHGVRTLALRLGPRRVVATGLAVLWVCYLALVVAGLRGLPGVHGPLLAAGHLALLGASVWAVTRLRLGDRLSVARFYLTIWMLFFAEYVVFGAAGVLA